MRPVPKLPGIGFPFPMAAASIPRGRLVSLVVPCAFLLGVLWCASARNIAEGVEGLCSAAPDDECFLRIQWPLILAIISLMFLVARWFGEAHAVAVRAAGGVGRPDGDLADAVAFSHLYLYCGILMLFGKMLKYDESAAMCYDSGAIWYDAGVLSLYVVHCCFSIPYFVLRLMWFLRDKCAG